MARGFERLSHIDKRNETHCLAFPMWLPLLDYEDLLRLGIDRMTDVFLNDGSNAFDSTDGLFDRCAERLVVTR